MKWPGSLTTPELITLLDDASEAVKNKSTGGEAGMALLRGDQAVAEGKRDEALKAYREALAAAPLQATSLRPEFQCVQPLLLQTTPYSLSHHSSFQNPSFLDYPHQAFRKWNQLLMKQIQPTLCSSL